METSKTNPLLNDEHADINNYRPLSILPKLIEKIMQNHLMTYLNAFDVLHQFQSGSRTDHSTETALT